MPTKHEAEWTDGIRPYQPLSTLKPVAPGVWMIDGPVMKLNVGPFKLPFPTRSVVIRLSNGGLWIWSPTKPTRELFAELDATGAVEQLVSPNKFHYASIAAWKQRYPNAKAWASPGVRDRAFSQQIDVTFDDDLRDDAPPAWSSEIQQLIFKGSRWMQEVVFFHRATSTLLVADMVMALESDRVAPSLRWLYKAAAVMTPGQAPREVQAATWGQQPQARRCAELIQSWQPARVIVGHGSNFFEDAPAKLKRAFAWLD